MRGRRSTAVSSMGGRASISKTETISMRPLEDQLANRVKILQTITIVWMVVELCVALSAGIHAHSIVLTAFGADSGIELLSALVVFRRFSIGPKEEGRAAKLCGLLLYLLGTYIVASVLLRLLRPEIDPQPTSAGIVLLVAAALIMPALGRTKKKLAAETGSGSLRADAAQSNICAYMSWIALAGLLLTTFFHVPWADSIAALLLLPIILKEAAQARRGTPCDCC